MSVNEELPETIKPEIEADNSKVNIQEEQPNNNKQLDNPMPLQKVNNFLYEELELLSKIDKMSPQYIDCLKRTEFYLPIAFSETRQDEDYIKFISFCQETLKLNTSHIQSTISPSYNSRNENEKEINYQSTYFPKLLISIKLLFYISLLYKYSYDFPITKFFITIYRVIVFQYEYDKLTNLSSIIISKEYYHIIYLSLIILLITSFVIFILISFKAKITISCSNNGIFYKINNKHSVTISLFHTSLVIMTYLYIPALKYSIELIGGIYDDITISQCYEYFFNMSKCSSLSPLDYISYSLAIMYLIIGIVMPFVILKIMKTNCPLLYPFNESFDIEYHDIHCPKDCKGTYVDLDKRICWDHIKDDLFIMDENRLIIDISETDKKSNSLVNYYSKIMTLDSPLIIMIKPFTYDKRYYFCYYLLSNFLLVFVKLIPYSLLFGQFNIESLIMRNYISYSLTTLLLVTQILSDIVLYNKKLFLYNLDKFLNLTVDIFVLIISLISLIKVFYIGNDLYKTEDGNMSKLVYIFEMVSFSFICLFFLCVLVFLLLSVKCIRSIFLNYELNYPENISSEDNITIQHSIIDYLWKPFWNNLFNEIPLLNTSSYIDNNFLKTSETRNFKIESPLSRLEEMKMKAVRFADEFSNVDDYYMKKSECLLIQYITHHLEGRDVFWDGKIKGKTSCKTFFGRLIVSNFPLKIFFIYDETNERVSIDKSDWIHLCEKNISHNEVSHFLTIRKKLRSLEGNDEIFFNPFYYEEMERNIYKSNLVKKKGKFEKMGNLSQRSSSYRKPNQENEEDNDLLDVPKEDLPQKDSVKLKGKLMITTINCHDPFAQGFNLTFVPNNTNDMKNQKPYPLDFITYAIKNNVVSNHSDIEVILNMNQHLITEKRLVEVNEPLLNWRHQVAVNRYLSEISLSSLFYNYIYTNHKLKLYELVLYFQKFEKRKEMKKIPYIYSNQIYQTMVLWEFIQFHPAVAGWYIYWYNFYQSNTSTLNLLKISQYFNPDSKMSICYCLMEKEILDIFLTKVRLSKSFKEEQIKSLYSMIDKCFWEMSPEKKLNTKQQPKDLDENYLEYLKTKQVKFIPKNTKEIKNNTTPLILFNTQYNTTTIIRSHFVDNKEKTFIKFIIPTWKYMTWIPHITDSDLARITNEKNFTEFFLTGKHDKKTDLLFGKLKKDWNLCEMYHINEIYQLYTRDTREGTGYDESDKNSNDKGETDKTKVINEEEEERIVNLILPPIFKLDKKYKDLPDGYEQKIDHLGKIFYVNHNTRTTSFEHPLQFHSHDDDLLSPKHIAKKNEIN